MEVTIRSITFQDIGLVWADHLWPGRPDIEPMSAMMFTGGYDMENFQLPARYIGIFEDERMVGVNSGHVCADNSFRSRGLWIDPIARGNGYGKQLLFRTLADGLELGCYFSWSLPRKTSWPTYESVGFRLTSDWSPSQTSEANAYCRLDY
jgi:GNAT superfamily N-acetyltransferase